ITKPLLVKVGALCIKKEGAHFDTPSFTSFLPQKVRRRGKKQEAEDDQTLGKGGNTGTQHPETGSAEYCTPTNKTLTTA
ncbi:hypothetical protein, partial [Phocaeicola vulgatus]|uniref:hypothetical protein n=2 Tax=Phocaeicola vulgatus TaxID=821 RepID=UPI002307E789|nr:hypothetical protein [Phocaeicola vulgatus]MDB0857823.1 hypothetical protein [Phocaeicola vulgatus]MDB0862231.1 hypothetical protein [Phocaeicola vulgatus]MDB0866349.1 hypothetical protein [Phocaeicola vulgatus]MDB0870527.1 hypothetical protein [Phocaeicola vulgatus]